MKRVLLVALVCFVVGTACGTFFTTRSESDDASATKLDKQGPTLSADAGEQKKSDRPAASTTSVRASELLDLASANNRVEGVIALYRKIENLDADALRKLAEEIEQLPNSDPRQLQVRNTLFVRYAQIDPNAALSYASSLKHISSRRAAMGSVITEIAAQDLQKAIAIISGIGGATDFQEIATVLGMSNTKGAPESVLQLFNERSGIIFPGEWGYGQIYANWARQDLQAALANVARLPPGRQRRNALQGIGTAMSVEAIDAGLEWAMSLTSGGWERSEILSALIGNVARSDPQRALALLESHAQDTKRRELLPYIAHGWLDRDRASAKASIGSLPEQDRIICLQVCLFQLESDAPWVAEQIAKLRPTTDSVNLARSLARRWGQSNPETAAGWVRSLPDGRLRDSARQLLVPEWAKSDPKAAAAFVSDKSLGKSDATMAGEVLREWIPSDPVAATAWMDELGLNSGMRASIIGSAISNWTYANPHAAGAYVLNLDGAERDRGLAIMMRTWGQLVFDSAQAWVYQIGDEDILNKALVSLIANAHCVSPEKAAAALTEAVRKHPGKNAMKSFEPAAQKIAGAWARIDPIAAATWAADLPDSIDRPAVLQSIANQWAVYDTKAATDWLQSIDPGPDRDGAVEGVVSRIILSDPESAFVLAHGVDDSDRRNRLTQDAVYRWSRIDSKAARAAVESADLSDKLRQVLLERIRTRWD